MKNLILIAVLISLFSCRKECLVPDVDPRCLDSVTCQQWYQIPLSAKYLGTPGSYQFIGPYQWDTIWIVKSQCDFKVYIDSLKQNAGKPPAIWKKWSNQPEDMYFWYLRANPLGVVQTNCY